MSKSEFVMLAHPWKGKHKIGGCFLSEKLDGIRVIWDGGISRGLPASEVPWANVAKHGRFLTPPVATGLWSRYAQPIMAPDYWLDRLPHIPLDGEAWIGRSRPDFQELCSITKTQNGSRDQSWSKVKYKIFDSPSIEMLFGDRSIDSPPNIVKEISGCVPWWFERLGIRASNGLPEITGYLGRTTFKTIYEELGPRLAGSVAELHNQTRLPEDEEEARDIAERRAAEIVAQGGEGVMIRWPFTYWRPERVYDLQKIKPTSDMEGTVVGYTWGRKTDKGSRLLGKMGAAVIKLDNGKEFELSGFTDAEREIEVKLFEQMERPPKEAEFILNAGTQFQGERVGDGFQAKHFPRGTRITFTYRKLTEDGLPFEARYFRKRPEGT